MQSESLRTTDIPDIHRDHGAPIRRGGPMVTAGVITDIHVEAENLEAQLRDLEETCHELIAGEVHTPVGKPDLLVILGDLIRDTDAETDRHLLAQLGDLFDDIDAPIEVILGNHDVMTLSTDEVLDILGREHAWWLDRKRELVFLSTGSPRLDDVRGELSSAQAAAVRTELPQMDDALVFVHHPVWTRDLTGNQWFEPFPEEAFCGNRRAYVDRGHEGAAAVVSGHLHEHWLDHANETVYLGVDAYNKILSEDQNGACAVVSRSSDGVMVAHRAGNGEKRVLETGGVSE